MRFSRSDFALLRRAARERWGVPDVLKTEALYQAADILTTSDEERNRLAAMKFLAAVDSADQKDDIEAARLRPAEAAGMKEVHDRMAAYIDPDGTPDADRRP